MSHLKIMLCLFAVLVSGCVSRPDPEIHAHQEGRCTPEEYVVDLRAEPTSSPGYAVFIYILKDRTAHAKLKIFDAEGAVAETYTRRVGKSEIDTVFKHVEQSHFWTKTKNLSSCFNEADGSVACMTEGTVWTLNIYNKCNNHTVVRRAPKHFDIETYNLIKHIEKIAGINSYPLIRTRN